MLNKESYNKRYSSGYGIIYPEGHVIRLYESILNREFNIDNWTLLDFGCGNGTHMNYFQTKGIDTWGVDISSSAIENGIRIYPNLKNHLRTKGIDQSLLDIFPDQKFNIIFSNQTLYYLDKNTLEVYLQQINSLLKTNGLVYFTMISNEHYLYNLSSPIENSSLRKVKHTSRVAEDTEVFFINSEADTEKLFSLFEPYFIGHYDIQMREGSRKHYQFLGKKR